MNPASSFRTFSHADEIRLALNQHSMSRCQNVNLSDELTKQKANLAEMEQDLAAECECLKAEDKEECAHEAVEARQQAIVVCQQQAQASQPHMEVPQWSALPVASHSRAYHHSTPM